VNNDYPEFFSWFTAIPFDDLAKNTVGLKENVCGIKIQHKL
jgi:hypothetical protein